MTFGLTPIAGAAADGAPAARLGPFVAKETTLRVLLVEDDDIDAKLVSLCAATIGPFRLAIERVMSSAEARARLAQRPYDLCIVDFWLGCESSIRFLTELDDICGGTPALVLTSLSTPDIRKICVSAGAAVFLGKADLSAASLEDAVLRTLATRAAGVLAAAPAAELDQTRARKPARIALAALKSMTETVRFGMFETFWADRSNADEGRLVDVGDFILGSVESASAILDERGQTVSFRKPDVARTLSRDPAGFFFVLFELLSRASRLSARNAALTISITQNECGIQIDFQGGTRIDATAGALALGPLCMQMLAENRAVFADTADKDGRFLLTVRFSTNGDLPDRAH